VTDSNRRELVVGPTLFGERVDRAVAMLLDCSRSRAVSLVEEGSVRVNGRIVSRAAKLREGDVVTVTTVDEQEIVPALVSVPMLYFDRDLAVIDKPAGLLVHRNGYSDRRASVAESLAKQFPEIASLGGDRLRAGIVHRLDQTTSGVMVVARSPLGYESLATQVRDHKMTRKYVAVVSGSLEAERGEIDAPIGRRGGGRAGFGVTAGGRNARTHYRRLSVSEDGRFSLVEVVLDTGRTHQIRVHFGAIDHPLLGDGLYGGASEGGLARPALHARELSFSHPISKVSIRATSKLPRDLEELIASLGLAPVGELFGSRSE